jgi:hypothetical protein
MLFTIKINLLHAPMTELVEYRNRLAAYYENTALVYFRQ